MYIEYYVLHVFIIYVGFVMLVGWLCFTSHQQGHLETVPPFTVPCEGLEARILHHPHLELNPSTLHLSPLHNRCAMPAPPGLCYTESFNIYSHIINLHISY